MSNLKTLQHRSVNLLTFLFFCLYGWLPNKTIASSCLKLNNKNVETRNFIFFYYDYQSDTFSHHQSLSHFTSKYPPKICNNTLSGYSLIVSNKIWDCCTKERFSSSNPIESATCRSVQQQLVGWITTKDSPCKSRLPACFFTKVPFRVTDTRNCFILIKS